MSKTPRTDHFMREQEAKEYPPPPYPIFDFARQLESENAEMAELLKRIVHGGRASISILEEARALLDKVEGK